MPTHFAPSSAPLAAPLFAGAALLDAEKLDCYRLAVESQALAGRLLPRRCGLSGLRDQLDRASVSGLAPAPACRQARSLLVRIVQMATRLNARMTAPMPS